MLTTFAAANYRSLRDFKLALAPLTLVSGANGSGKSNLYRALRLLQLAAQGRLAEAVAAEGGIASLQWAGPADAPSQQRRGLPAQGTRRRTPLRIMFGFATDDLAYRIELGLPAGGNPVTEPSRFRLDPEVKAEYVWQGIPQRSGNTWLEREGGLVRLRDAAGEWQRLGASLAAQQSVLSELSEPQRFPEVFALRERLRGWRFYDGFRTDAESPLRQPRISVQTGALAHDGRDLAAALQTVIEIGDAEALHAAVDEAMPGSRLRILGDDARLQVGLDVDGLLRPLQAAELSDGTLRYLCLLAALHSPRPPELLVLNEPEQSLHADLLRPLARQIVAASRRSQLWIISHAPRLVAAIEDITGLVGISLLREHGETRVAGRSLLEEPAWP